jgi:hypothetical protein
VNAPIIKCPSLSARGNALQTRVGAGAWPRE